MQTTDNNMHDLFIQWCFDAQYAVGNAAVAVFIMKQ